MKILVALPTDELRESMFPASLAEDYSNLFQFEWNEKNVQLSPQELASRLADVDFLVTGWGCCQLDNHVLKDANNLKLVLHLGGSVAEYASEELFERGVRVVSGNKVMARFVAEAILSYVFVGLRDLNFFDRSLKEGQQWPRDFSRVDTLFNSNIGFLGLGTVGRYLLELLQPFEVKVKVFDPFISEQSIQSYPFVEKVESLEEVLMDSEVISVHASLTQETKGMIGEKELRLLNPGTLIINAARAGLFDQKALYSGLAKGSFKAVLDVYHEEPLPLEDPLRNLDNVVLVPHMAAAVSRTRMAPVLLKEIERFLSGEDLPHEIGQDQFRMMTRNWI